jgi:hypothetical protein
MNRRIEFTLNLDDPQERAIFEALTSALRHRRAGELIRQALNAYLMEGGRSCKPAQAQRFPVSEIPQSGDVEQTDSEATARILDQSASMFGF